MTQQTFYTVGELADICGEPLWKIRHVVDALPHPVPRAGQYRLVPIELLPAIQEQLHPHVEERTQ